MEKHLAKALEKFAQPVCEPRDENRPNEDRPMVVRPPLSSSQVYRWITEGAHQDYSLWYRHQLQWRKLPLEQKHKAMSNRMAREDGMFRTLLPEVYGEEGLQILDAVYASFAPDMYYRDHARGLIKEPEKIGPRQVASYILTNYDIIGVGPLIVMEASDERVRLCPIGHDSTELCSYGTRKGDWRMCAYTGEWETQITKLMNPKLRCYTNKAKNCGDWCCEITIEWDTGEEPPNNTLPPVTGRPEPVRPELEHSDVYNWIVNGAPKDAKAWLDPVPIRHIPMDQKLNICSRKWAAETGAMRTMMAEVYGDKGYETIEKAYASMAPPEYELARIRGLTGEPDEMGPLEAARYICTLYDIAGRAPLSIPEASDECVRIQHFVGLPETCYYLARKGDWRMCVAETAFERNLTKMMNPRLRAQRTKSKIYGDYCCELTIDWDPDFK